MIKVKNKWNKKEYGVVNKEGNNITLEREDGTCFTISYSEFKFSYLDSDNSNV